MRPNPDSTETATAGIPLTEAPGRRIARLLAVVADRAEAGSLAALGVRTGETIYVHKRGEPTIISLGGASGRRVGLSAAAARRVRVQVVG